MQARALAALVVCGFLALGAVSASGQPGRDAGTVTGSDPAGDVSAPGLTPAERDAIDIVSVKAIGKEGLGVFVTVTFKGNFTGLIGRGHLTNAAAAIVLKAKSGEGTAGLVTLGAGATGKVLRRSQAQQVGVVRHGRQAMFFIVGPGYGDIGSVTAEVLVNPPSLGVRTTAGRTSYVVPHIPDEGWSKLLGLTPDDMGSVSDPMPLVLTKAELLSVLRSIGSAAGFLEAAELLYGTDGQLQAELDALNLFGLQVRLLIALAALSPLNGTVAPQAGGVVIVARNSGADLYDALRFTLGGGVHHTGARLVGGLLGRCGPGNGPSDVLCTLDKPLAPGQSASVLISTDKPYPPGTAVQVFAKKVGDAAFGGPFVVGGNAAAACECVDISAKISPAHGNVTNPRGPVHLSLIFDWTLSCSGGSGTCAGQITVDPSGDLKVTSPPGGTAACTGKPNCPETSKGRFVVRMTSEETLHNTGPGHHDVPITVKIYCKSGKSLVLARTALLVLYFGTNGLLDPKLSDLKA